MRDRYITNIFPNFLSSTYNASEMYVESDDYCRTIDSA